MNAALVPYAQILSHGLKQRRNAWGHTGPRLSLAILVGLLVLGWFIRGTSSFGTIVCIALVLAITGVFGALVSSVFAQNRPLMARLVPAHVQHLRQTLWGVWLAASLLATGAALGLGMSVAAGAQAALWGLGMVAVLLRWPVLWTVAWVLPNLVWWTRKLPAFAEPWAWHQAHPTEALLISLLVLGFWLGSLVGKGDERHRRSDQQMRRWLAAGRRGETGWGCVDWPRPLCWLRALVDAPYRLRFSQLCAKPTPRTLPGRLMLGLGPSHHWTTQIGVALVFFVVYLSGVLIAMALAPVPLVVILRSSGFGVGIGLISALMARLWPLAKMLDKTRGEQGLLMLVPGLPRGRALNRALGWRWLLQFGLSLALGAGLLILESMGTDMGRALPGMIFFILAYLMPLALICRDWARWQASDGSGTLLGLIGLATSMGLAFIASVWFQVPFAVVAGVQIAVPLAIGLRRWRQQLNAAQALPVSRLV